jgi:hypothetical protein
MTKTSLFTNKDYSIRVTAKIDSSPAANLPSIGGANGHIIKLNGFGFSTNIQNYSCKVSGQACQVTQAN